MQQRRLAGLLRFGLFKLTGVLLLLVPGFLQFFLQTGQLRSVVLPLLCQQTLLVAQLQQGRIAAFQPGSPLGLLQPQSLWAECLFPEGQFFFFRFYLGQLAPGRIEPLQPLQGLLQLLRLAPGLTALLFQPGQLLPQGLLFVRRQQGLAGQFLAHVLQQELFLPVPFMHQHGDTAVFFRAGDAFKDGRPAVGRSIQKGRKTALRQHHGTGETVEVQAGDLGDHSGHIPFLGTDDLAAVRIRDLVPCRLEPAFRGFSGPPLAPVATVTTPGGDLEDHLRHAFPGLAGHDLVLAVAQGLEPRRPPVQGQTDGVQDGRFAGTRGAGDGKDTGGYEIRPGEVYLPDAGQGIEVLKTYVLDTHGGPYSALLSVSCMAVRISPYRRMSKSAWAPSIFRAARQREKTSVSLSSSRFLPVSSRLGWLSSRRALRIFRTRSPLPATAVSTCWRRLPSRSSPV